MGMFKKLAKAGSMITLVITMITGNLGAAIAAVVLAVMALGIEIGEWKE